MNAPLHCIVVDVLDRSYKDAADILRTEMKMIEKRLATAERQREEYFDEKCEMEEAENDARLLAQR